MAEENPETITSRPVMLSSLPEVSSITGMFFYNYFTPDERITEDQDVLSPSNKSLVASEDSPSETISTITDKRLLAYYKKSSQFPRVNLVKIVGPSGVDAQVLTSQQQASLRENLTYVNASSTFRRVGLSITNTKIDETTSNNLNVDTQTTGRPTDILGSLVTPMQSGYVYSTTQGDTITSALGQAYAGISFNTSLIANTAADLVRGSLASYKNVHVEELISSISAVSDAQDAVITQDPYVVRLSDFEQSFPTIDIQEIQDPSTASRSLKNTLVGFVVEKYSLNFDGTIKVYDSIIYTSPVYRSFTDSNVAYGRSYRYRIRCIYACEFEVTLVNGGNDVGLYKITVPLVSNGKDALVDCIDRVAPPPPVDLRFRYLGEAQGLAVTWQFPVNLQRDIKKFQVYRRSNISEPFRLLRVFDFDDSIIKTEDPDLIPAQLITTSTLPCTLYKDASFTKDSKFIYAIVAVDAHGLSSNYSMQIEVTYDKYRNRIINKIISRSGAARPYPNIYLNVDTFVDTMKMSGYKKLSVYFDPDYAKVQQTTVSTDGSSTRSPVDFDHIVFSNESDDNNYKLMIVNTDMQKSQTLTLKIKNNYVEPNELEGTTSRVFVDNDRGTSTGPFSSSSSTSKSTGSSRTGRFPRFR